MKSHPFHVRWSAITLSVLIAMAGCAAKRVDAPPAGQAYRLPWGAVPLGRTDAALHHTLRQELITGLRTRAEALRRQKPQGRIPYRILALSGGGSRGAYGAGVLMGWTAAGTRPEFDVVTGVSTGAIMGTFAFLGPEYDDALRHYTNVTNEDIYRPWFWLEDFFGEAIFDTTPLRELLAKQIDDTVLAAVAREHAEGRRFFVGTTNLDANAFTVWDMGAIAASTRPDRLERYRDVIMASAAVPVIFPPVYIPVETDGERSRQMHVDGAVRESVFFYDFPDEAQEALSSLGMTLSDVRTEFYVLHNDTLYARGINAPVEPLSLSIARASLMAFVRENLLGSLYRLWVQALINGFDFHIAYIPPDFPLSENPLNFDPEEMQRLFELGHTKSLNGQAWYTQRAGADAAEIFRLIDPMEVLTEVGGPPQLDRNVE